MHIVTPSCTYKSAAAIPNAPKCSYIFGFCLDVGTRRTPHAVDFEIYFGFYIS